MDRIISIRPGSVRVRTGLVSFDVKIVEHEDGKITLVLPSCIYVFKDNFNILRRLIVNAYLEEYQNKDELE